MLAELNKALGRRYFKAYETGDIDAVMEFIDPKYVLHPRGGAKPMNAEERRREETVFFRAFSNIQVRIEDQLQPATKSQIE
jgi:ketosteroid isomerase-like protein